MYSRSLVLGCVVIFFLSPLTHRMSVLRNGAKWVRVSTCTELNRLHRSTHHNYSKLLFLKYLYFQVKIDTAPVSVVHWVTIIDTAPVGVVHWVTIRYRASGCGALGYH